MMPTVQGVIEKELRDSSYMIEGRRQREGAAGAGGAGERGGGDVEWFALAQPNATSPLAQGRVTEYLL